MATEIEVLGVVSDRLSAQGLSFMLTGSFALACYATPRMTRDLDIVVALGEHDVARLVSAFATDFYVDADAALSAVRAERLFNLMHLQSGIKVDFIARKASEYRQIEFARRQAVAIAGIRTWIVSREDLVLSKLVWSADSGSEMQARDVRQLLAGSVDDEMNDTSALVSELVSKHHNAMTPAERWHVASAMFETARTIVDSSLSAGLTEQERRLAVARRLYGGELPDAALMAHAMFEMPH